MSEPTKYFTESGKVVCLECGHSYEHLGHHFADRGNGGTHEITFEEYKEKYPDAPTETIDPDEIDDVDTAMKFRESLEVIALEKVEEFDELQNQLEAKVEEVQELDGEIDELGDIITARREELERKKQQIEAMIGEVQELEQETDQTRFSDGLEVPKRYLA